VSLSAAGALYVDGAPSTETELRQRLAAARRTDPEVRAVIAADGAVQHRRVSASSTCCVRSTSTISPST